MINYINQLKTHLIEKMMLFKFFQKILGKRWVSRWLKNYKLAEQELSILPHILEKNSIIFDIGANRGELSFFFATKCDSSKVFSFEPQNRIFGILTGVAKKIKNIIPINVAMSDSTEKKTLKIPIRRKLRYTPAASLEDVNEVNLEKEKIKTVILDNFVYENNINKIDFIKCDTEGHELAIMKGSEKTLTKLRPILYIEVKDSNKKQLINFLKSKKYNPYQWDNKNSQLIAITLKEEALSENYYFFPIEKEKTIIEIIKQK